MIATVIGYTMDSEAKDRGYDLEQLKTLSGKVAGICYGQGEYFNTYITDPEKANKRFRVVAKTGHHSIADHANVTILFEGIPKMVAMVLNSLQVYATSERSGRYTEMSGSDERELTLYTKWKKIFQSLIAHQYPAFDEKTVEKLSMENARYFLSVFTPTTMAYTTSLRQWNYILDWCEDYMKLELNPTYFNFKLYEGIRELSEKLRGLVYVEELRDLKKRHFGFLPVQTVGEDATISGMGGVFMDMYRVEYSISFAGLGQAQRHRTLRYQLIFDGDTKFSFYKPYLLQSYEDISEEWERDMLSIFDLIPQATLVQVSESGHVGDFLLKCQERICSRAQLEIAQNTTDTLRRLYHYRNSFMVDADDWEHDSFSQGIAKELDRYITRRGVNPKCVVLGGCAEPCVLGGSCAVSRLI